MSSPSRRFKDAAYAQLARVGKAVSSPKRLELLDLLAQAPRTVEALAHEAGLSIASASQHLQTLRSARLVRSTKQGLYVQYRLADDDVARFFVTLRARAHTHLPELEQTRHDFWGDDDDDDELLDPSQLM